MREMVRARRKEPKMPSNITKNRGGYVCRIFKTVNGEKRTIYGSWCTGVDEALAQREALLEARERGASYDRLVELATSFKAPRFRDAAAAAQVNEATSRRLEKVRNPGHCWSRFDPLSRAHRTKVRNGGAVRWREMLLK
ncbi:hypothetical protein FOZ62_018688 [Perkinsus olseni]|uniref:Uncharacterized protein n=1 Tax=Perkinsus olseni TaxID=32597 RepID=A0A7J6QPE7_PEROL|nr:hypothetical protein FOZ62_018688 [Perkinsus olseni]